MGIVWIFGILVVVVSLRLGAYMYFQRQRNVREKRPLEITEEARAYHHGCVSCEYYEDLLAVYNVNNRLYSLMVYDSDYIRPSRMTRLARNSAARCTSEIHHPSGSTSQPRVPPTSPQPAPTCRARLQCCSLGYTHK